MVKTVIVNIRRFFYNVCNRIVLRRKQVIYNKNLIINGIIKLHGNGRIEIGSGVTINSSESSNPIGGMTYTMFSCNSSKGITIGENVGMSNVAIVCQEKVTIGNHVKLGGSVKIYDTDFHSLDYLERTNNDCPKRKEVIIDDYAFVGAHSIILKGVRVGKGAIIGAGSVVTKSVPDFEIWGGNPAHFIRKQNIEGVETDD